jgi:hypothetical protein
VEKSPLNRPGSEYFDVLLTFFDPRAKGERAPLRARFTIDVSDTVPVVIGDPVLGTSTELIPSLSNPELQEENRASTRENADEASSSALSRAGGETWERPARQGSQRRRAGGLLRPGVHATGLPLRPRDAGLPVSFL